MGQIAFDERTARSLERAYQKRDMVRRRTLAKAALAAQAGERILDVGCGPGFYEAELLDELGADITIVAVDQSPDMLAMARGRNEGRPNITFLEGSATKLPVGDGEFDAVLCVQVMEYVADPVEALTEFRRVLRPGGRAVIWDTDWTGAWWHSADPDRMRRVMTVWDEHLAHPGLPRTLAAHLRVAGFTDVRVEGHSFASATYDPESFGGAMVTMLTDFVTGRPGIPSEEAAAWAAEQAALGERGEYYFQATQYCFCALRPG